MVLLYIPCGDTINSTSSRNTSMSSHHGCQESPANLNQVSWAVLAVASHSSTFLRSTGKGLEDLGLEVCFIKATSWYSWFFPSDLDHNQSLLDWFASLKMLDLGKIQVHRLYCIEICVFIYLHCICIEILRLLRVDVLAGFDAEVITDLTTTLPVSVCVPDSQMPKQFTFFFKFPGEFTLWIVRSC